jgi:hypothetical protein
MPVQILTAEFKRLNEALQTQLIINSLVHYGLPLPGGQLSVTSKLVLPSGLVAVGKISMKDAGGVFHYLGTSRTEAVTWFARQHGVETTNYEAKWVSLNKIGFSCMSCSRTVRVGI